jgi:hypothetical protein
MCVTETTCDLNEDGKGDQMSIWLMEGKKYNDTDLWDGAGQKYEGRFIIVVEIGGMKPVTSDLNRLFYPQYERGEKMFFWCSEPWKIVFADYNHDGQVDFNLGQYRDGVACTFRFFTVSPKGEVSELPVQRQPDGILGPRGTHSTPEIEPTDEGFLHSYYSRLIGTQVKSWYGWDKDKRAFVLARQQPVDKRPEPTPPYSGPATRSPQR